MRWFNTRRKIVSSSLGRERRGAIVSNVGLAPLIWDMANHHLDLILDNMPEFLEHPLKAAALEAKELEGKEVVDAFYLAHVFDNVFLPSIMAHLLSLRGVSAGELGLEDWELELLARLGRWFLNAGPTLVLWHDPVTEEYHTAPTRDYYERLLQTAGDYGVNLLRSRNYEDEIGEIVHVAERPEDGLIILRGAKLRVIPFKGVELLVYDAAPTNLVAIDIGDDWQIILPIDPHAKMYETSAGSILSIWNTSIGGPVFTTVFDPSGRLVERYMDFIKRLEEKGERIVKSPLELLLTWSQREPILLHKDVGEALLLENGALVQNPGYKVLMHEREVRNEISDRDILREWAKNRDYITGKVINEPTIEKAFALTVLKKLGRLKNSEEKEG